MNLSQLDAFLRKHTPEEEYIINSLNLPDSDIKSILLPVLRWTKEDETPVLSGEFIMNSDENISISKHHRFIPIPSHQHDFIELFYIYSGSCTQTINGKKVVLKEGDLCILDTHVIHSIEKAGENDIIINCLMRKAYFDASILSRLSSNDLISNFLVNAIYQSKDYNNFISFHSEGENKLHEIMVNLMCEYFEPSICSKEIINCYVILMFSELLKIYHNQAPGVQVLNHTAKAKNITKILEYIQENYANATLTSTAEAFNFHPNYLSTLLKKSIGKSFKEITNQQKLKKACALLKNTDMTIEDVSLETGYNNISFFYIKFKEAYGVTPLEYKQTNFKP